MSSSQTRVRLHAVLVLYKVPLANSQSYQSLAAAYRAVGARLSVTLTVYDNSPEPQARPTPDELGSIPFTYQHDPKNGGLVAAYNAALQEAQNVGAEWLLLLDQDTNLPQSYLESFLDALPWLDSRIACVLPKVAINGRIRSPKYADALHRPALAFKYTKSGIATSEIVGINSAAFVNVAYLKKQGGYPSRYWLDSVDLWFFAKIYSDGMRAWVLDTTVEHELSTSNMESVSLDRWHSITSAHTDFQIHMRGRIERATNVLGGFVYSGVLVLQGHKTHARIRALEALRLLRSLRS